jgi:hypothetical protein
MTRPASPFAPPPIRRVKLRPRKDPVTRELAAYLERRDGRCAMAKIRADHVCDGPSEIDHVRASGGLGLRSESSRRNCVRLCRWGHLTKTYYGKVWRPILLDWIARNGDAA